MAYFDTQHKKRSATYTGIIAILILLLIFNFGLRYLDPPEEFGISVNFGTTDFGSGNVQPKEALKPAIQEAKVDPVEEEEIVEEEVVQEEEIQEEQEVSEPSSEAAEKVLTQDNEEAIAIKKQEEAKRIEDAREKKAAEEKAAKQKAADEKAAEEKAAKQKAADEKAAEERRIAQEEAEKRKKLDALVGGIGKDKGKADGGEGNDEQPGDKGSKTGDPNASGFYGNGAGVGSGGNYQLGNREAKSIPKPTYDCNEQGRVYVKISVNQSGNVIAAEPGVKGTTNSASCLLNRAKEAALKATFNSDSNAPSKQVGVIIYNFSLN